MDSCRGDRGVGDKTGPSKENYHKLVNKNSIQLKIYLPPPSKKAKTKAPFLRKTSQNLLDLPLDFQPVLCYVWKAKMAFISLHFIICIQHLLNTYCTVIGKFLKSNYLFIFLTYCVDMKRKPVHAEGCSNNQQNLEKEINLKIWKYDE